MDKEKKTRAKKFISEQFSKKMLKLFDNEPVDAYKDDIINYVIKTKAWNDAFIYTKKTDSYKAVEEKQNDIVSYMKRGFEKIQSISFKVWHKKTVEELVAYYGFTHGTAQKFLNMSVKYFYFIEIGYEIKCFAGIELKKFEKDFDIPIDSYILNWLVYNSVDDSEKAEKILKYNIKSWNAINSVSYRPIQEMVKNLLRETYGDDDGSLLFYETEVWEKIAGFKKDDYMTVNFKGIVGEYAIGECGVVNLEAYRGQGVENKKFKNFDKKELFWSIYDQIIIPTREKAGSGPDSTFRLLCIEEKGDTFIFHYNIDEYDDSYCEVKNAKDMTLEALMSALYEDFCNMAKALPDDDRLIKSITWDKTRKVSFSGDYLERLKKDVFYTSWKIETSE